jgi:2-dehydro-3-deoxyphosphogluconate aldolase/(4S)-4-hydroxy-2-oxoglutarate aldolase
MTAATSLRIDMNTNLLENKLIPVLAWDDPDAADAIARGLIDGGLPIVEVTFRSPRARSVLEALAAHAGLLVGAGTVTSAEQVAQAHASGAQFVVSPGLSASVVRACQELGLPTLPGVSTPSEIMAARDLGISYLKFFPVELLGGAPMLKALAPVFPDVQFIPSGGIGPSNIAAYLSMSCVPAVGGSWMFDRQALAAGDVDAITNAVSAARQCASEV